MYLLRDYLRNGGTLEQLKEKYAIDATRHKTYPQLVLLKYNQIESPFAEKLVQEARGIILDEADNWRVVCQRYPKFFNFGEGHAAKVDWNTARVDEKVDGSLITLYYYDNQWHAATSGSPDASGQVHGWNFTFADLFWKTFNEMGLKTIGFNTDLCPSFELTSMFNRVVVPHKNPGLTFIGLHDRLTSCELPLSTLPNYPAVKSYKFATLDDVVEYAKTLSGVEHEGFVVVDANYNRVKIKGEQYVALHHLKDSWGPRRIVEIVRAGEISEVVNYFPEFKDQFEATKARYDKLVNELHVAYDELKHIEIQKDFALAVQARKLSVPSALFRLRAGQITSAKQQLAELPIHAVMKALGLKDKNDKA